RRRRDGHPRLPRDRHPHGRPPGPGRAVDRARRRLPRLGHRGPSHRGRAARRPPVARDAADVEPMAGRVAVVTGGSRGVGRGLALALARAGAGVAVNYARSRDLADAVVREVGELGRRAVALPADVSRAADVERLLQGALAAFGRIDAWVNNAGADIL